MRWLHPLSWVLAAAMALAGCDSIEEDLCDEECECERCTDWEYDDCLARYDRELRDAEYWGCEDRYDAWMDCREATWYCDRGDFETRCGHEKQWLDDCTHR